MIKFRITSTDKTDGGMVESWISSFLPFTWINSLLEMKLSPGLVK